MKYNSLKSQQVSYFAISLLLTIQSFGQNQLIGSVSTSEGPLEFASVVLDSTKILQSDSKGLFTFDDVKNGHHDIEISFIGYKTITKHIDLPSNQMIEILLESDLLLFDEIVVTGTKTFKRQTQSAVIVNIVDSRTLDNVQACNLSEGLKFQPGLRVETDCQTCNYTQLRMNGLAGGYSQILINGRPIFSPLTGLYGLEQIPVNMIDKIEVIRGGGSSLYGSSAIGGTVNVLTKIPTINSSSINTLYQNINNGANDFMLNANSTLVAKNKKSGISLFLNRRVREAYDHNEDNFSEIPEIKNTSIGMSSFILPAANQKIEISLSNLNEFRYGGELTDKPAHLALQSEERTHNVWMASADYQINFNNNKSNFIAYTAWQNTARDHYTGIVPDEADEIAYANHFLAPPYGTSLTKTIQGGIQLNHNLSSFLGGSNVFTFGSEYLVDETFDEIESYNYMIDQVTKNFGAFAQSDWEVLPSLNLLSGVRLDNHNLVDRTVLSPRLSLLYKYGENTQIRASYGTGFRAPQAFDTDLHIAFAGGGVSRVQLSDDLREESSQSYSASLNFDKPKEHWVAGFTIEGFYTQLNDAFTLVPIGEDDFGQLFEKRNDQGAVVKGSTIELRANYDRKIQIETGITIQSSQFENPVKYIDDVEGILDFIRTPNIYGFANLSLNPSKKISGNINFVYTGSMIVPHFAGAPNQTINEIFTSSPFSEVSTKVGYKLPFISNTNLEFFGGIKNIFNSYQKMFDIGKNRDSNFVFGPSQPRTFFIGMKWSS
jgi:outer membrane receptor for ferrienterochelin and colicins